MSGTPETQAAPDAVALAASPTESIQATDESRELTPALDAVAEGTEEAPEPKADVPEAEAEDNANSGDEEGEKPNKSRSASS